MSTRNLLLKSLSNSAGTAKKWFIAETTAKCRQEYFAKNKLEDLGNGAVYAYFAKDGNALYVGESSRPIKRRMHDQTSPHKNSEWWNHWETVRLLSVIDRTDRITLELLLVLALQPLFNVKPRSREFSKMFASET